MNTNSENGRNFKLKKDFAVAGTDKDSLLSMINQVISKLETVDMDGYFSEPVDHVGLGLHDYLTIIKTPMDLSTIQKKIQKYRDFNEFYNELKLIWENCMHYNVEGSIIYQKADQLRIEADKTILNLKQRKVAKPKPQMKKPNPQLLETDVGAANTKGHMVNLNRKVFNDPSLNQPVLEPGLKDQIHQYFSTNCNEEKLLKIIRFIDSKDPSLVSQLKRDQFEIKLNYLPSQICEQILKLKEEII